MNCFITSNPITASSVAFAVASTGQKSSLKLTNNLGYQYNCDPAYPDFCIPKNSPDLNCRDISQRRFKVLPPDPHGFDRDGDGIGCEK